MSTNDPLMRAWSDRIRATRTRLGLSQPDLGRRIGVTKKTVSEWERGIRFPSAESRRRLMRLFVDEEEEGEEDAAA